MDLCSGSQLEVIRRDTNFSGLRTFSDSYLHC